VAKKEPGSPNRRSPKKIEENKPAGGDGEQINSAHLSPEAAASVHAVRNRKEIGQRKTI